VKRPVVPALAAILALAGCATAPDRAAREERPRYEAYADRPKTAGEYWAMRELEDRIEAAREGNQTRRP
jgi:hypothetical protein